MGQREMAQMIIDGLRPRSHVGHSVGLGLQDPGDDGDVEEDHPPPRTRRGGPPKRCNICENELSVSFVYLLLSTSLTPD
jgi:hypothetical protein